MRCISYCTAKSYQIVGIVNFFRSKNAAVKLYRKVVHVVLPEEPGDIFIFNKGCFVTWGLSKGREQELFVQLKPFSEELLKAIEVDQFIVRYGEEVALLSHERFNTDIIVLDSDSVQLKLALSYGLAQSIKLEAHEEAIQKTIKKNAELSEELADYGKISLSRRDISKRMGEIFLARSDVNLDSDFLDMPEYFWQNPNLEPYYAMTEQFLDIQKRVNALNQKLDVLHELIGVLTSHLEHRHSSILEWTIIILIFVEILLNIFKFHLV
jgi:uncharacterized Rmd1/YagE family protein